jgi:hypothetical protein
LLLCQMIFAKFRFVLLLGNIIPLSEFFNPSAGIYQFLFSCKERMALGTNFYVDVLFGRTGHKFFSASATNRSFLVIGMDSLFHDFHLPFLLVQIYVLCEYSIILFDLQGYFKFFCVFSFLVRPPLKAAKALQIGRSQSYYAHFVSRYS